MKPTGNVIARIPPWRETKQSHCKIDCHAPISIGARNDTKIFILFLYALCVGVYPAVGGTVNIFAKDEPNRAHILVSNDAIVIFKDADTQVKDKNWSAAIANYQKLIESYSQYVIPADKTAVNPADRDKVAPNGIPQGTTNPAYRENEPGNLFYGVKYLALESLKTLPPEGKEVYRKLYDSSAKALFESAFQNPKLDRLENLKTIIDRYPFSSYGEKAFIRLSRYHLEKGDAREAKLILDNLISYLYPQQTNIPKHIASDLALAESQTLRDPDPPALWSTYGGNNQRSQWQTTPQIPQGHNAITITCQWSFPDEPVTATLAAPVQPPGSDDFPGIIQPIQFNPERYLPYFPAVYGDMIYLPTETTLYALPLDNDKAKRWKFKAPCDEPDRFIPAEPQPRTGDRSVGEERTIYTVTVSDNKIYLPLVTSFFGKSERQLGFLDVKYAFPLRTLFCFDAANGKVLWSTQSQEKVSFTTAPLVESNTCYASGIQTMSQTDLPEYYLFAFDSRAGADNIRWKTFITSGILETNLFNNPSREPLGSCLTADDTTLYYCSHIGVTATVDKYSGMLKWLRQYPQYTIAPVRHNYTPPRLPLHWINNPIIYVNSDKPKIIVTPFDSPYLLCLSADSGIELWRWDGQELGATRYLVGVNDDLLVVAGEQSVICLSISSQGKRKWVISGHQFRGKPALTATKVYAPTVAGLLEIDLKSGKLLNTYPWLNPKYSGNLLLLTNNMITTSASHLNVFSYETTDEHR
ncbi:MAG: PQQ-like beta-propeller repeat protein [Planctomycetes bacterium]|nr:PQQ-like beta-propeller repeat protein [Planctomycetota bacterium]